MNVRFFIVLVALVCFFPVKGAEAPANAVYKIALIDVNKALFSTKIGEKASADLQKDLQKDIDEITRLQNDIKSKAEKLKREQATYTPKQLNDAKEELVTMQQRFSALDRKVYDKQAAAEQEFSRKNLPTFRKVLEALILERGYTLVLHQNSVVYAVDGTDITAEVVNRLNAGAK